jgi:hypothetical protein
VAISVDGRRVESRATQLNNAGQWTPFGSLMLARGPHTVTVHYDESGLLPGSGAPPFAMGPVAFSPSGSGEAVVYADSSEAATLCERTLDWVEAVS